MLNRNMLNKLSAMLIKQEKRRLFMLSFGSILLSISEAFSIGIIIPIINLFIAPEKIKTFKIISKLYWLSGAKDASSFLNILIICAFLLFVFKLAYSIFMLYEQQNIIGQIYNRLTTRALDSYLKKTYAFHLLNNSTVLFKNVSSEVSNFVYYFLSPVTSIGSEVIISVSICILLLFAYPALMVILFSTIAVLVLFVNLFLRKRIKSYAREREVFSEQMYKTALESLGAIKDIQVFNAHDLFVEKYFNATKRYTNGFMRFSVVSGLPRYIFEMAMFTFVLAVILLSPYLHKTAGELIPMLTVLGVASLRLLPSFSRIYTNLNLFQYGTNSLELVYEILAQERSKTIAGQVDCAEDSITKNQSLILLNNVTFYYKEDTPAILENFNLSIYANHNVAFVGKTGSGKSTLVDIIMGLLIPVKGALCYKGMIIKPENVIDYRKNIGYVPQSIFLVDDTISANIAFGASREHIDFKRLEYAVKVSQLESFIRELPEGVNTLVGERGVRISGGQRQRIGIARALYRDPGVFIFDEATSALDVHTEANLYSSLRALKKTILIVTHRLSTIENADIIYVLNRGKIIESGNFKELSRDSEFFQLVSKPDNEPAAE